MAKIKKIIGKKGVTWQIDYIDPHGKRVRQMFKKRKEATAELGKRVSLIAEGRYLDVKKDYKTTLRELVEKYKENFNHQSHYQRTKKYCLRDFMRYMGDDRLLASFSYLDLETYCNRLKSKLTRRGGIRKPASLNREMACIHHLFKKAASWKMIEKSPFDGEDSFFETEHNKRVRYLSKEEIIRLLNECSHFPYLRRIAVCAINTGMDKGVILNLKWKQIKNDIIYTKRKKTGAPLKIPVNDELAAVFKEIRREQGLSSEYIFTKDGTKLGRIDMRFKAAVTRAEIDDFTFKDLRHTFASHLVMAGRNLKEVQELMGHENIQMTMRYAHLGPEQRKDAVSALNGLTGCIKPDMSENGQILKTADLTK